MNHGGDIYGAAVELDLSVSLNPYPVPEPIGKALEESLKHLGEYPDTEQRTLRKALAEAEGVDVSEIFAGNGASELISAAVGVAAPERVVLAEPGFYGYRHALGQLKDCHTGTVSCEGPEALAEALKAAVEESGLLCISDPWNPWGENLPEELLAEILEKAAGMGRHVLLDESFYLLSGKAEMKRDTAGLIRRYPGLFIIRSLTKLFAMPGIRMGYVIASAENIRRIRRRLPEWNISVPAMYVMEAAAGVMKEGSFVRKSLEYIGNEREFLTEELKKRGFAVNDSDTVYLSFRGPGSLYGDMLGRKVLIRQIEGGDGDAYYRIGVKKHDENLRFLGILDEVI